MHGPQMVTPQEMFPEVSMTASLLSDAWQTTSLTCWPSHSPVSYPRMCPCGTTRKQADAPDMAARAA